MTKITAQSRRASIGPALALLTFLTAVTPAQSEPGTQALPYLSAVMPASLVPVSNIEVAGLENLTIQTGSSGPYLVFRMFPDQAHVNNGNRAELSFDPSIQVGDTTVYQWRLRIPAASETDLQNRWWLLAQWHDQPDTRIGQSWDGHPDNSPSIALGYGNVEGQDMISFNYGAPDLRPIIAQPLTRDDWHQIRMVIHWSNQDTGWAAFYIDDMNTPLARATGRNMFNTFQHYLKLGTYRSPDIQVNSEIHLDDLSFEIISN